MALSLAIGMVLLGGAAPVTTAAQSPLLTTSLVPSGGSQTTANGYPGASLTFTSALSTSVSVLVFGDTINQLGQTVSYSVQGLTVTPQGSATVFFSAPVGVHGNYEVVVFATTVTGIPLSVSTSIPVKV